MERRNSMRAAMLPDAPERPSNAFTRFLDAAGTNIGDAYRSFMETPDRMRQQIYDYQINLGVSPEMAALRADRIAGRAGMTTGAVDLLVPQTASDVALTAAGPLGRVAPRAGRAALAAGGAMMGMEPSDAEANVLRRIIRAYHGSPHNFEKFDLSKVGTGEGNQAFGPGLYFAENENVARGYRDRLAMLGPHAARGEGPQGIAARLLDAGLSVDEALAELTNRIRYPHVQRGLAARNPQTMEFASNIAEAKRLLTHPSARGHMYEVNIHSDPDKFIDWDRIHTSGFTPPDALKELVDNRIKALYGPARNSDNVSYNIRTDVTQDVLKDPKSLVALRDAGVPGVQYYDAGSRGNMGGSRNFVVFDDKTIELVRKYGIAGLTMGGATANAAAGNANSSD